MKKYNRFITVLGWEDRFFEGVKTSIDKFEIELISLIYYKECEELTETSKIKLVNLCKEKEVEVEFLEVNYSNPIDKWMELDKYVKDFKEVNNVLLDITTMPRDTIWSFLFFLTSNNIDIDYIYYSPKEYNKNWLSKEPGKPRLLLKHSGITKLGNQTALIIITGFESERAKQLINFFEPKLTVLGFQIGNQFENEKRNREVLNSVKGYTELKSFDIDAYSEGSGYDKIMEEIEKLNDYNIVLTSLGPKPTAISMYRIVKERPEIALAYVPSKQFNDKYSTGIGDYIHNNFHYNK